MQGSGYYYASTPIGSARKVCLSALNRLCQPLPQALTSRHKLVQHTVCPHIELLLLLKVCGAGAEHSCLWRASEHASSSYLIFQAPQTDFPNQLTLRVHCIQSQGSLALQAAGVPRRHADIVGGGSGKLSTCYMPPPLPRLLIDLIDAVRPASF